MTINKLTITIIVDNRSVNPALLPEHGFALWIEADGMNLLFDTAQTEILFSNALALGIDLRRTDALVLSHGHFDHTGCVGQFAGLCPDAHLYCHPGVFIPRYSRHPDGPVRAIGIPETSLEAIRRWKGPVTWTLDTTTISDCIGVTGNIPRATSFEDTGGAFFLDPDCTMPDPIVDDMAMWCITGKGVTVITGCCHSGLVNTLAYIRPNTGQYPLETVIGGFHLVNAGIERITSTGDYLLSTDVRRVVPCHCTGDHAVACMKHQLGTLVEQGYAGMTIDSSMEA
jgi:7,8-dihydropterin-6-yl-methyl-4-(beta-D-ribofuranosyl)aminobenzene 5'-phosphate synthase